jgi:uncharacterized protein (DUF302 family)
MLILQNTSAYGFGFTSRLPFGVVIEQVKEAFEAEGFGIVSQIDMRDRLCKNLGASIQPYTILGFCNPNVALRALRDEPEAGLLMPCNVLVRSDGRGVHVSALDPRLLIRLAENNRLRGVSDDLFACIERALERFAKESDVSAIAA